jgi:hypothetical protein
LESSTELLSLLLYGPVKVFLGIGLENPSKSPFLPDGRQEGRLSILPLWKRGKRFLLLLEKGGGEGF